ncbi:MAG: alpha/beta hydrolase [Burkholderiales bacterium]|nr:alpha/beta hydrolase [Burkholderiales bacterium]
MNAPAFSVLGADVYVEGQGAQTLVMIHGWPDTYRLWDSTVLALQGQYRCVRFTLPGFEGPRQGNARTLADITALLLAIVDEASPDQPVTLVLHDWGCLFGYELAARHPDRVNRIVGLDIGDATSPDFLRSLSLVHKLMIAFYQLWLATAWGVGRYVSGAVGDAMTRFMARAMRCPAPPESIRWFMNFPYAMAWLGVGGGLRGVMRFTPHCPMLFVYGKCKLFMFHSGRWLERLNTAPGSKAVGLSSGHWLTADCPAELAALLDGWLAQ